MEKRKLILHTRISEQEMKLLKEIQNRYQQKSNKYISMADVVIDAIRFYDGQLPTKRL